MTIKLVTAPGQALAVGVIMYVKVSIEKPAFTMVWLIVLPLPAAYPERLGELEDTVQEKVVPATPDVRLMAVVAAEHMVCVKGRVVSKGVGLTVTIMEEGCPEQPFADEVTW